uniref:Uncharacterized protein n=1 Tax=Glossina austeni TaxID=7395 RepID=A0A1A9V1Z5_GLOAU
MAINILKEFSKVVCQEKGDKSFSEDTVDNILYGKNLDKFIGDLAGINAWILYKEMTGEEISRQEFLFQLAEELGTEYQKEKQISKEFSSKTKINTNGDLVK